jgi:hypothetical protein
VHFSSVQIRLLALLAWLLLAGRLAAAPAGPTLLFDYGNGRPLDNSLDKFMYFVPLIAPEPVFVLTNAGNTQGARVLSFVCRTNAATFSTVCEFEFTGEGFQQYVFDNSQLIKRKMDKLKAGETIARQLGSISVTGSGHGSIRIEGVFTNGLRVIHAVELRFNGRSQTSPVTISLQDIRYRDGAVRFENEIVARVNSLAFRRKPGTPKMEVTLASLKAKASKDGLWQNLLGNLKGAVANLFIPPLTVAPDGHQAMLDFGQALATQKPEFTFPFAIRLKTMVPPND